MYEGKNIHFSQTDQKPLCSFSGKVCNQRRLNNYGFCVRHILEDTSAPFKQCAYVAKSSRQTCTQPIPKQEERDYCNNHMQVLGMLPKKERKPKNAKATSTQFSSINTGAMSDPGLLQNKLKPKHTAGSTPSKMTGHRLFTASEEGDDVYTFPTDNNEKNAKTFTALVQNAGNISVVGPTSNSFTSVTNKSSNDASSGQSSLAKIYPELAEKLEKIKPKIDTAKLKGKVKSSRTMNRLQTKIAQNKIKDKLKRNQSSSNGSSQSQSPSHSYVSSSPGFHINSSSPNHVNQTATSHFPEATFGHEQLGMSTQKSTCASNQTSVSTLPRLSNLNLLNGLNLQTLNMSLEQLGLPVQTMGDIEQTLKQLAKSANIPLDGSSLSSESQPVSQISEAQSSGTTPLLLPPLQTFTPQAGPPPPYPGVSHKSTATVHHTSSQGSPVKQPKTPVGHQVVPIPISTSSISTATTASTSTVVNVPLVTKPVLPTQTLQAGATVPLPVSMMSAKSAFSQSLSAISLTGSFATFPAMIHPNITLLTPSQPSSAVSNVVVPVKPPSQEPVKQAEAITTATQGQSSSPTKPKPVKMTKPRSRNPSSGTKRPVPLFSLPMTVVKPRKLRKMLDENEVKTLKKKSAIELYNRSVKRKIDHHYMIYPGLVSSDESDGSDSDALPWQRDWLTPSSDEEVAEDEDDYTLRTAKLALCRARQRRQCFQSRRSSRTPRQPSGHCPSKTGDPWDVTACLVEAARESPSSAVRCLLEVKHVKVKMKDRYKLRGTEKRQCLYRDNEDVQCKNIIVPYANHCIKHVMYNVDQQLFEYCTAKFADNTQCCHPVIDVKHELPLCMEHGLKADNFLKAQDAEPKPKKPRKKTKPSALTRPPKKGKKKKNQRKNAARQAAVTAQVEDNTTGGDTDIIESSEEVGAQQTDTEMKADDQDSDTDKPGVPCSIPAHIPSSTLPVPIRPLAAAVTQSTNVTAGPLFTATTCTVSQVSSVLVSDNVNRLPSMPPMANQTVSNHNSVMSAQLSQRPPAHLNVRALAPVALSQGVLTSAPQGSRVVRPIVPAVTTSAPVVVRDGMRQAKSGSLGQLEELDNLTGLSVLENVKMFSDLETTASKLLEENDFQDVFNKLPDDVTFDLFNNKGSTEDLQYLEDSLALASREMSINKEPVAGVASTSSTVADLASSLATRANMVPHSYPQGLGQVPVQPKTTAAATGPTMPLFEDDFTRQMAEEVLKQNIGPVSITMANSICNGDAEASIAAIARSLSNTGQLLAAEADQKSKSPNIELPSVPQVSIATNLPVSNVSRAVSLPAYSTLEYFPPNVVIQNLPLSTNSVTTVGAQGNANKAAMPIPQVFAGTNQSSVIPQNVTVTPQGIITSNMPVISSVPTMQPANLVPSTQTVAIGNTAVTGNQATGIITLPTPQQLTAQQLSALVQQAAAQLPPLPPYKPRQQRLIATTGHTVQHTGTCIAPSTDITQRPLAALVTGVKPVAITSSTAVTRQVFQPDLVVQQLTKQQEQILAQQLLQQKVATVNPQTLTPQTLRMTLPSSQSLGFSAILQHGQIGRLNQSVVQAVPNLGPIAQLIKPDLSTSQTLSAPISLPTTNIVWTSPPNVTITSPNGLPRQNLQPKTVIPPLQTSNASSSVGGAIKETFIDLTESDPPPYEATQSVLGKSGPPPSYPTQTSTNSTVTGKS